MAILSLPVSAIHFFYAGITRKKAVNQGNRVAPFGYCCSTGTKTLTVKASSGIHEVGWILSCGHLTHHHHPQLVVIAARNFAGFGTKQQQKPWQQ
jgi:hypothetical protein